MSGKDQNANGIIKTTQLGNLGHLAVKSLTLSDSLAMRGEQTDGRVCALGVWDKDAAEGAGKTHELVEALKVNGDWCYQVNGALKVKANQEIEGKSCFSNDVQSFHGTD